MQSMTLFRLSVFARHTAALSQASWKISRATNTSLCVCVRFAHSLYEVEVGWGGEGFIAFGFSHCPGDLLQHSLRASTLHHRMPAHLSCNVLDWQTPAKVRGIQLQLGNAPESSQKLLRTFLAATAQKNDPGQARKPTVLFGHHGDEDAPTPCLERTCAEP